MTKWQALCSFVKQKNFSLKRWLMMMKIIEKTLIRMTAGGFQSVDSLNNFQYRPNILNNITGNWANPLINESIMIITQLSFYLYTLSHSHRWLFDRNFTKLPYGWVLWDLSLRTVLAGWLSGQAPWLPLYCKLLSWEKQVGGNLWKKIEANRAVISTEKRSVSHVMIPKLDRCMWSYLKDPEQVFSTNTLVKNHGRQKTCRVSALHNANTWYWE